jgi:integrase
MISALTYQPQSTTEKSKEILDKLQGYWMKDVWNLTDVFFEKYGGGTAWPWPAKNLFFNYLSIPIGDELKLFLSTEIINDALTLKTVISYANSFKVLREFIDKFYPKSTSLLEIKNSNGLEKYKSYLLNLEYNKKHYVSLLNSACIFMANFYDDRDEFEKDVWDVRRISGARYTKNTSDYALRFDDIPPRFRDLVKGFIKYKISYLSKTSVSNHLRGTRYFLKFVIKNYPDWTGFTSLNRFHIEEYLVYFNQHYSHLTRAKLDYISAVRIFIDYLINSKASVAPLVPIYALFFKEDLPRQRKPNENEIKHIPEHVIVQLESLLIQDPEQLNPLMSENHKKYIPVVILLIATGWRISDILNLRYDNCLVTTTKGFYLQGDIPKTEVKLHRVPIDNNVALVIQTVIEQALDISTPENNPEKYLFIRTSGKRKGESYRGESIRTSLNIWAIRYNIIENVDKPYKFGNHAFRHTKGVELINLGMSLMHVMKWFAHASPEMTLVYAKIADDTLRLEWEKAQEKKGPLLRINFGNGQVNEMNMDEDLIHWEYIRANIEAIRVPLGYCLASKKEGCPYVVTPCLTCPNFCTTPDNLPDFEREIKKVEEHIDMTKNYPIYNEKTKEQLDNLIKIRDQLADGKSHRGDCAKKVLFEAQITIEKGVLL